jgi:hypothetical protein
MRRARLPSSPELDVDGEADTAAAETPDGALVIAAGRVLYGLRADGAVRYRVAIPRKVYASPAIADDGRRRCAAHDRFGWGTLRGIG